MEEERIKKIKEIAKKKAINISRNIYEEQRIKIINSKKRGCGCGKIKKK